MGENLLVLRKELAVHLPMLQPDCTSILLEENTNA
jgi:hypothetical protein